jgi:hypothetical protein
MLTPARMPSAIQRAGTRILPAMVTTADSGIWPALPLLCTHRRTLIMKLRLWVQSKGVQQEPLRIGPLRAAIFASHWTSRFRGNVATR